MRKADREKEAERICVLACNLEGEGHVEAAIELYRMSSKLGFPPAWTNLSRLLGDLAMPGASSEALYWLHRLRRNDPACAAWNLAMYHRQRGRRTLYLRWLEKAAAAGDEDAVAALNVRNRHNRPWWVLEGIDPPPMAKLRIV